MVKKRQTISVTMASYNNEDCIGQCLDSVKDWADEIIVVDGYSTDKTVAIAKKYGARVLLRENNPVFHIQKQVGNDAAISDWILQLDTDEVIPISLREEIKALLNRKSFGYSTWISPTKRLINKFYKLFPEPVKLKEPATAYWLPRKNYFLGRFLKNTGQYPDPIIRLFQKGKAHLPAKDVHEQMVVNGKTGWLTNDYEHFGTPTFARYLLREDRYSSLTAQELKSSRLKINFLNTIKYILLLPLNTFLKLYFRYRGFLDGFPGFVFALYSGLHFAFAYMKLWELYKKEDLNIQ